MGTYVWQHFNTLDESSRYVLRICFKSGCDGLPLQISLPFEKDYPIIYYISYILNLVVSNLIVLSGINAIGMYFLSHSLLLVLAFSLRSLGKELKRLVEESKEHVYTGIQLYLTYKSKMNSINGIVGNLVLCYYFSVAAYFITLPDTLIVLIAGESYTELSIFSYFLIYLIFWIVSANYHGSILRTLRSWLDYQIFENFRGGSKSLLTEDVKLILGRIKGDVEGGCPEWGIACKFFVVTNDLLKSVCLVVKMQIN